MATIKAEGIDEYLKQLDKLGRDLEKVCKAAVFDGAAVVADAVRDSYYRNEHPFSENGNEVIQSLGLSKMRNDGGFISTKLGFSGYNSDGRPNAVIARTMESGNSHQAAKPFVRPALKHCSEMAKAAMKNKVETMIKEISDKN